MGRLVSAAVEEALAAFGGTRGPAPSDEALWANFAWRFGYGELLACVEQGRSEMNCHARPVPPPERPRILQNILRGFWNKRFPKTPAAERSEPRKRLQEGGAR